MRLIPAPVFAIAANEDAVLYDLINFCLWTMTCVSIDDLRSGRPERDECTGWVDYLLYIHEEYYIQRGELFNGKVIAITEDTITVKKWRQVARVFRVSPVLASADLPLERVLGTGHRLNQLKVGDWVCFDLAHAADGYVCRTLGIYRRPGGQIPEAEDSHLPSHNRLHIRCAVDQFVEENVVPKMLPRLALKLPH